MPTLTYPGLDSAIANFEGYNVPGSLAQRNNNPGNIKPGTFANIHGAIGEANGFAVFPDPVTGMAATDALVGVYADRGATIQSLLDSWAPPNAKGNTSQSTQNYIDYVSKQSGVPSSTPISTLKSAAAGAISDSTSTLGVIGKAVVGAMVPPLAGANITSIPGMSWGRIAAFLLGLIVIGAALYSFKPVQQAVNTTVATGSKIGTKVAMVAA